MAKRKQARTRSVDHPKVILENLRRASEVQFPGEIAGQLYRKAMEQASFMKAAKAEAEQLFEALCGADLWRVTRYVEQNPPSPAAIGWLILVARAEVARKSAKAPRPTELRKLVEEILNRESDLTCKGVLRKLESVAGNGVVLSVKNGTINWQDKGGGKRPTSIGSGLPSLVSRVKQALRERPT